MTIASTPSLDASTRAVWMTPLPDSFSHSLTSPAATGGQTGQARCLIRWQQPRRRQWRAWRVHVYAVSLVSGRLRQARGPVVDAASGGPRVRVLVEGRSD